MIGVREEHHRERLVDRLQRVDQLERVVRMHVVVDHAVQEQQVARELARVLDAAARVVAFGILLRRAHIALGVDRVVVAPVGGGRDGDRGLERVAAQDHRGGRHVAAVARAGDADARAVDVRARLGEMRDRSGLVVEVDLAELEVRRGFEGLSAVRRAAVVDRHRDEPKRRVRIARGELVGHQAHGRAAVGAHDDGVLLARIERRRERDTPVEIGLAISRLAGEELARREVVRLEALRVALGERRDEPAVARVDDGLCRRRNSLGRRDEICAVRRKAETVVMEVAAGHTHARAAVELGDMQLLLHSDLAAPRGEPEFAGLFVDLEDLVDGPLALADRVDERAVDVAQLVVLVAGLLRLPDEALAVLEEVHARRVVLPGVLLLVDDDARLAGRGIRGEDIEHILAARRARDEEFAAIRRPAHVVEVVLGVGLGAGNLAERVDFDGLLGRDLVHHDVRGRVRCAGLGIRLAHDTRVDVGPAADEEEVLDLRLVEAIERDETRVGAPPHRGGLVEFLAVDPRSLAVLDVVGSVGGDGDAVAALLLRLGREKEIALLADRGPRAVGAVGAGELPAARGTAATAALAALRARGVEIRRRLAGRGRDRAALEVERLPAVLVEPELARGDVPLGVADGAAVADPAHRALHAAHELVAGDLLHRRVVLPEHGRLRCDENSGKSRCKAGNASHPRSVANQTRAWRANVL